MSTVLAPGAPRHSPTTMGWPGVGWIFVVRPIFVSWPASHSAQRFVSGLCSDLAETEGIRRNSKSSSWIRCLLVEKKSGMPKGITARLWLSALGVSSRLSASLARRNASEADSRELAPRAESDSRAGFLRDAEIPAVH